MRSEARLIRPESDENPRVPNSRIRPIQNLSGSPFSLGWSNDPITEDKTIPANHDLAEGAERMDLNSYIAGLAALEADRMNESVDKVRDDLRAALRPPRLPFIPEPFTQSSESPDLESGIRERNIAATVTMPATVSAKRARQMNEKSGVQTAYADTVRASIWKIGEGVG